MASQWVKSLSYTGDCFDLQEGKLKLIERPSLAQGYLAGQRQSGVEIRLPVASFRACQDNLMPLVMYYTLHAESKILSKIRSFLKVSRPNPDSH